MKPFTVVWLPRALDRRTDLWLSASNRQAITDSTDKLDQVLATVPLQTSTVSAGGSRFVNVGCLHVIYLVNELDRMVTELDVRLDQLASGADTAADP